MDKIDTDAFDPANEPDSEKFHRLARVTLGAIPVAGGALAEVFNSVLESPLNKRRTEAMVQIGEVINDLLEKGVVTIDGLQENDAFISTVSEVCSITLRNHEEEKLKALRNAVKNSALPTCPSDDYRQIFLNFVDVCTATHIRLLVFLDDPEDWGRVNGVTYPQSWGMGTISRVIQAALPEVNDNEELFKVVWADLFQRGLIDIQEMDSVMSAASTLSRRTTRIGRQLVEFIRDVEL
ncbi:hypothetical protein ISE70_19750 [Pseudomonas aeruginosa]|uniref:hypothetical protein n=1 Tax=Pseudomonas aeruginosa TaxID=287 RepID=UPI00057A0F4E|nr:hypothetical protein [Pseudomonas aeruginosa]MBI8696051.1 hypothetical protein [Pseudomonas aeruginosa]MBX5979279.1 hypothetical protein [Pseudomonas aeruginosa]MBX5997045.1 hypothetical protein [Pseudomonas aeruginosa]MCT5013242.1 hypothetical protein [Pseudomonas aeruginosa]MCT5044567.1 hypothetical protein [Pseudomonas aeruginosa]